MRFAQRLLGAFVLLLATVVFVGCVAGIVGVWAARQVVSVKVETLTAQLDRALERASGATETLLHAMETVRGGVRNSKADPVGLEPGGFKNQEVTEFLNTVIQRLDTFSELAPVASSLLRNLQRYPFSATDRIKSERLERASARAARLSATAKKLRERFDRSDDVLTEKELVDAAAEVDYAVGSCEAEVDEWRSDLVAGRAELPGLKARILRWMTLAALAATVLAGWLAVSQISVGAARLEVVPGKADGRWRMTDGRTDSREPIPDSRRKLRPRV